MQIKTVAQQWRARGRFVLDNGDRRTGCSIERNRAVRIDCDQASAERDVKTVLGWLDDVLLCGSEVIETVGAEILVDGDGVDAHEMVVEENALGDEQPGSDVLNTVLFGDWL